MCKAKLVSVEEAPDLTITLREAAMKYSNLGGQGYDRCNCTQQTKNVNVRHQGKNAIQNVILKIFVK